MWYLDKLHYLQFSESKHYNYEGFFFRIPSLVSYRSFDSVGFGSDFDNEYTSDG